jgi:hypothetical protein
LLLENVPGTVGRPEDGDLRLTVTVIVRGDQLVGAEPPIGDAVVVDRSS